MTITRPLVHIAFFINQLTSSVVVALCVFAGNIHRQTIDAQDFDRRRVPTRGLDDVLVSDELKGKLDKVRRGFPNHNHLSSMLLFNSFLEMAGVPLKLMPLAICSDHLPSEVHTLVRTPQVVQHEKARAVLIGQWGFSELSGTVCLFSGPPGRHP